MMNTNTDAGKPSATLAPQLAALAHPARLAILRHLSGREACCCKEVVEHLDLAQSTVSQHLKVLVEAGLVHFSAERQRSRYMLDRKALESLNESLSGLFQSYCGNPGRD